MSKSTKVRLLVLGSFVLLVLLAVLAHPSQESDFTSLFSDMSIGVPGHQAIIEFNRPAHPVKGDYFATIIVQSDEQFRQFCRRIGTSAGELLAVSGATVTARSRIDTNYPWLITITAAITNAPQKAYRLKIEGRQPYN